MRLLLDTQVLLWVLEASPRLKPASRRLIESADEVYVSAASIWEIAIKARLGKLDAHPLQITAALPESGLIELPVTARHAAGVVDLPPHHHDPFDRLLVAQALAEPLKLITADALLKPYTDLVVLI